MPTVRIELEPGDILYREGSANDSAFIVESGEIILYNGQSVNRVECERRGPGSIVGELSILTGQPRTVTVEALTPCIAYQISAEQIEEQLAKVDPVLRACIDTSINFAARFEQAQEEEDTDVPMAPSTVQNIDMLLAQIKYELDIEAGIDRGEFSMIYQPVVHLSDKRIAGFEALMRWAHPIRGNVPPDQFIEVAEDFGSIGKLTEFALAEACKTLRECQSTSEAPLFASVNVSGKDIDRAGFVDFLAHILDHNKVQPRQLKLEVTETALVPDSLQAERNLKELRRLGCGISIDDFGTGYSNFAYLKTLPLTALKIDRAFAGDVNENAVSRSIVRMLVGLGKELDVDIVAEGMETKADAAILRELGCRFAQGYYFHKPMPQTDLIYLLSQDVENVEVA